MVEFKFIEYGTDFGTRDMGQKLRQELLPLIKGNDKVVLDFTGVNVVSNSFADECIAKLLLEMPLDERKQHTTFKSKLYYTLFVFINPRKKAQNIQ